MPSISFDHQVIIDMIFQMITLNRLNRLYNPIKFQ